MSNHYGPHRLGYTCATKVFDKQKPGREPEPFSKRNRSSDRSLKPESVKAESLVIENHHVSVNQFPSLVHTARHAMEIVLCGRLLVVYSSRGAIPSWFFPPSLSALRLEA